MSHINLDFRAACLEQEGLQLRITFMAGTRSLVFNLGLQHIQASALCTHVSKSQSSRSSMTPGHGNGGRVRATNDLHGTHLQRLQAEIGQHGETKSLGVGNLTT